MNEQKKYFDILVAVKQYALVSDINRKLLEIEELQKEVEKICKKGNLLIFEKKVSMEFIKACNGSMFHEEAGILDQISISCSLRAKSSCAPADFILRLYLTSGENTYSFIIAKNKGGDAGYLVQTKDDNLLIEDGGGTFVQFHSAGDFNEVMNYCEETIDMVNVFLKNDELIRHINAPIGSSSRLNHPLGI